METQVQPRVWTRESVLNLLNNNDKAVARALWSLFQRQTADEQAAQQTRHHNGVGFNGRDAEFLSDIAKRLPRYDFRLTAGQVRAVRRCIRKYLGQLLDVIEEKGGVVDRSKPKNKKATSLKSEAAISPKPTEHQSELWGII